MQTYAISCPTSKLQYFKSHIFTFHTDKSDYVIFLEGTDVTKSFKLGLLAKYSKKNVRAFLNL
jgi:hypothetical protein